MSTGAIEQDTQESVTTFPAGFVWGAATAAYQIEGTWTIRRRLGC